MIEGSVRCAGSLAQTEDGWRWSDAQGAVTLGQVFVFDADGQTLPARLVVDARGTVVQQSHPMTAGKDAVRVIDPRNDFIMDSLLRPYGMRTGRL